MANAGLGKCTNFGNCTKADTGELINLASGSLQFSVCPECGENLLLHTRNNKALFKTLAIIAFVVLAVGGGGVALFNYLDSSHESLPATLSPVASTVPSICTPLLMEGKKSLFQRVLTKPSAQKAIEFGGVANQSIAPFSRYYVYERKITNNEEWLAIGSSVRCQKDGWVKATDTIEWKQQLSLTFTNTATKDRGRAYFFKDKNAVILDAASIQASNPNIVAVEPENYVDPKKNFYLIPILEFTKQDDVNLLKVATATLNSDATPPSDPQAQAQDLAIVFVVDTTISMKPYIEKVKEAVQQVYERFHNSPFRDHVKFGLIAFRSNIKVTPKLEYVTKLFVNPTNPLEEKNFINIVDTQVNEAKVSSIKFDEDSYAGISSAIYQIDWEKFLGRNIVLITDAGAIEFNEKLPDGSQISAVEDLNSKLLKEIAQKSNEINIYALHLKTPSGKKLNDHEKAAGQYRELTHNSIADNSLYFGKDINEAQTDFFSEEINCIVQSWTALMLVQLEDNPKEEQQLVAERCPQSPLELAHPDFAKQQNAMRSAQVLLGHALRLKYLGVKEGTQVKDSIEGWINDRTTETSPMKVQVNVVLSRSELNTLGEKIKVIIESAQDSRADTSSAVQFFSNLKKKASTVVNDPNRLNDDTSVGELLNLEELQDLPYSSHIMQITEQVWAAWSNDQREDLLKSLKGNLKAYEEIERDSSAWHKLAEESDANDEVALIPLTLLP